MLASVTWRWLVAIISMAALLVGGGAAFAVAGDGGQPTTTVTFPASDGTTVTGADPAPPGSAPAPFPGSEAASGARTEIFPASDGTTVTGPDPPRATETVRRGSLGYCVNSRTRQRTSCSGSPRSGLSGRGVLGPFSPRPGQPITLVSQLKLTAASGASRPDGLARIVKQSGKLGVTITGLGLPANTRRDGYAVWLIDGPRGWRLLGFVNPAVTRAGRLRTVGPLPADTFRYHQLAVTRETRAHPTRPGAVVLASPLHP